MAPLRDVLLVGNSVNGTVTVIDDDGQTFRNLGTINVIPDLGTRMLTMNMLFWQRLIYGFVKRAQLVTHLEPDGGNRFIDDLFLSPDGTVLYVSRSNLADVVAFDLADPQSSAGRPRRLWRHRIFAHADHATLSADGNRIVVSASASEKAYVLDAKTGARVGSFPTGAFPHQNDYSADGRHIYNGNLGDLDAPFSEGARKGPFLLTKVDATTLEVKRKIVFEAGLRPMVLTDDEATLFIQLSYVNGVMKYDIAPRSPAQTPIKEESPVLIARFDEPESNIDPIYKSKDEYPHNSAHHGLAMSKDGRPLCDCGTIDNTVSLVNTADMKGRTIRNVGKIPYWATTSHDGAHCLVSLSGEDRVAIIQYNTINENDTRAVRYVELKSAAGDSVTERKNKPYFPQRSRLGSISGAVVDRLFGSAAGAR